ncbi:MAG: hypothetical protein GY841_13575 [FCB group bacterium]|nr:hypothetical protein [FCB group bacterium]
MQRQVIYPMVEGDTKYTSVRFTGMSTDNYTSIKLRFKKENGQFFTRDLVYDGTDLEVAVIRWVEGDITVGEHTAEFDFKQAHNGFCDFRLPRQFPVIFRVRPKNG